MKVTKKLKQTVLTVMESNGHKEEITLDIGVKIRNPKKFTFDLTEGNAVYVSHRTQVLTYEMELEKFLKYANLISKKDDEFDPEQEETDEPDQEKPTEEVEE